MPFDTLKKEGEDEEFFNTSAVKFDMNRETAEAEFIRRIAVAIVSDVYAELLLPYSHISPFTMPLDVYKEDEERFPESLYDRKLRPYVELIADEGRKANMGVGGCEGEVT